MAVPAKARERSLRLAGRLSYRLTACGIVCTTVAVGQETLDQYAAVTAELRARMFP
jgi:hypothetical protein